MNLKLQKELSAKAYGVGKARVKIDPTQSEEIKDAITRADIKGLVDSGAIKILQKKDTSRHRARARKEKRKKGRARGHGRRRGPATARTPPKTTWINRVRLQRATISRLKKAGSMTTSTHRELYLKAKGGFFRNRKHLLQYINQHKLATEAKKK